MGVKLSIDKHVSNLDEVLEISAQYYAKVKFESKINPEITHHLKVSHRMLNRELIRSVDLAVFRGCQQVRFGQDIPDPTGLAATKQFQVRAERSLPRTIHLQGRFRG